jgi:hypothetical protein
MNCTTLVASGFGPRPVAAADQLSHFLTFLSTNNNTNTHITSHLHTRQTNHTNIMGFSQVGFEISRLPKDTRITTPMFRNMMNDNIANTTTKYPFFTYFVLFLLFFLVLDELTDWYYYP